MNTTLRFQDFKAGGAIKRNRQKGKDARSVVPSKTPSKGVMKYYFITKQFNSPEWFCKHLIKQSNINKEEVGHLCGSVC